MSIFLILAISITGAALYELWIAWEEKHPL